MRYRKYHRALRRINIEKENTMFIRESCYLVTGNLAGRGS